MYRAVVLEPEYEGNVGFLARLAENFAIDELVFVNPQCDFGETAMERASHAADRLRGARVVDALDTAVADLDYLVGTTGINVAEENVLRNGVPPARMTADMPADADVGVLLGREGKGLSNDELDITAFHEEGCSSSNLGENAAICDMTVSIPTSEQYPVMNLSHAAAVVFYELYTAEAGQRCGDPSSRERREVLENLFKGVTDSLDWEESRKERTLRVAASSGCLLEQRSDRNAVTFRNVLGRAYTTDRELQLLLGAFRETHETIGGT